MQVIGFIYIDESTEIHL